MNQYFDENEIRKTIEILKPDNELFEIRVLMPGKKNLSGYFRDADTVIDELGKVNMREANVFITLRGLRVLAMTGNRRTGSMQSQRSRQATMISRLMNGCLLISTRRERESPAHQAQTRNFRKQRHSLRR